MDRRDNNDLATIYRYRHHPKWRWTHGYLENVAHAIALAVMDDKATGRIYNVGEQVTTDYRGAAENLACCRCTAG